MCFGSKNEASRLTNEFVKTRVKPKPESKQKIEDEATRRLPRLEQLQALHPKAVRLCCSVCVCGCVFPPPIFHQVDSHHLCIIPSSFSGVYPDTSLSLLFLCPGRTKCQHHAINGYTLAPSSSSFCVLPICLSEKGAGGRGAEGGGGSIGCPEGRREGVVFMWCQHNL